MTSLTLLWYIVRPQFWRLDRRVRSANRLVIIALIAGFPIAVQKAYQYLLAPWLAQVNPDNLVGAMAPLIPTSFFILLLFAILGADDMLRQLYISSDVELLMAAPVPMALIFAIKFAACSRAALFPGLLISAIFATVGWTYGVPSVYYLQIACLTFSAIVIVTAATMSMILLLVRFLPPKRVRAWTPLALIAGMLSLALAQQPLSAWLLSHENLVSMMLTSLIQSTEPGLTIASAAGLALVAFFSVRQLFVRAYFEGWNRYVEVPIPLARLVSTAQRRTLFARLTRVIPSPLRQVMVKEWLEMSRETNTAFALALPLVFVAVLIAPLAGARALGESLRPLIFWSVLAFGALIFATLPTGNPMFSVLREGRNLALLRVSPVPLGNILAGKYWATWLLTVPPWLIAFALIGAWQRFPFWQTFTLIGTAVWSLTGASAATMALAGLTADFTKEDPKRRISWLSTYVAIGTNLLFILLTQISAVWLLIRFLPSSPVIQMLALIAGHRLVQLGTSYPFLPLLLLGMQSAFWLGVRILWRAAVRRQQDWEAT